MHLDYISHTQTNENTLPGTRCKWITELNEFSHLLVCVCIFCQAHCCSQSFPEMPQVVVLFLILFMYSVKHNAYNREFTGMTNAIVIACETCFFLLLL